MIAAPIDEAREFSVLRERCETSCAERDAALSLLAEVYARRDSRAFAKPDEQHMWRCVEAALEELRR